MVAREREAGEAIPRQRPDDRRQDGRRRRRVQAIQDVDVPVLQFARDGRARVAREEGLVDREGRVRRQPLGRDGARGDVVLEGRVDEPQHGKGDDQEDDEPDRGRDDTAQQTRDLADPSRAHRGCPAFGEPGWAEDDFAHR